MLAPVALIFCFLAAIPALAVIAFARSWRDRPRPYGMCFSCGYSLNDLPSRTCPECGTDNSVKPEGHTTKSKYALVKPRFIIAMALGAAPFAIWKIARTVDRSAVYDLIDQFVPVNLLILFLGLVALSSGHAVCCTFIANPLRQPSNIAAIKIILLWCTALNGFLLSTIFWANIST